MAYNREELEKKLELLQDQQRKVLRELNKLELTSDDSENKILGKYVRLGNSYSVTYMFIENIDFDESGENIVLHGRGFSYKDDNSNYEFTVHSDVNKEIELELLAESLEILDENSYNLEFDDISDRVIKLFKKN